MTVLFVVKAAPPRGKEAEFNRWYNDEHVPDVLKYPGVVSARRYKAISGEGKFEYMAVYEIKDEATYRAFIASDHMKALVADYDKHFPDSERMRFAYQQVFP
jgi:uncharacterized protein (TIGR02118 family)